MSTFRSILSSVKYHALTRPAITATKHAVSEGFKKLANRNHNKRKLKLGLNPQTRNKVLNKTRGDLASSPNAFSKHTLSGQKRRMEAAAKMKASRSGAKGGMSSIRKKVLFKTRGTASGLKLRTLSKSTLAGQAARKSAAKQARGLSRPRRARTGKMSSLKPSTPIRPKSPHGSVQAAVNASGTHGQLRRKITGMAVRKVTREVGGKAIPQADRKKRADLIRATRKANPKGLRSVVRGHKAKFAKEAAGIIHKRTP